MNEATRDPRDVITPDAFRLDPTLLGIPLGTPARRLVAILIDLVVVGFLSALTSGFGAFVWGLIALFLVTTALRRPQSGTRAARSWVLRASTGCLGFMILVIVVLGSILNGVDFGDDGPDANRGSVSGEVGIEAVALAVGGGIALASAEDTTDAREAVALLLEAALTRGQSIDDAQQSVRDALAVDKPWAVHADSVLTRALRQLAPAFAATDATPADSTSADSTASVSVAVFNDAARDSLTRVLARLANTRSDLTEVTEQRDALDARLRTRTTSIGGVIAGLWDEIASGFGLWSIYFTLVGTVTQGRTIGKRITGLRVMRLDGQPLTWWSSFERAGGYAAGLATGLLGFAQVFWDPNRQCVQDKIGSTVVIDTRGG